MPTDKNMCQQSNTNPNSTIYIVTGAAGCGELHEPFTRPQPPRSAFRSNTFGYSRMYIHNASHIRWQQVLTDRTYFSVSDYGDVIDDVWIVQHEKHGPFSPSRAPSEVGDPPGPGQSIDHWAQLSGDGALPELADELAAELGSGNLRWMAARGHKHLGEEARTQKLRRVVAEGVFDAEDGRPVSWEGANFGR